MNRKVLMILIVLISFTYPVLGDTSFTVSIVDGQTMLNFSTYKTATGAEPAGQNASLSVPWAIITNVGDVIQTFKIKYGGASPTGIYLYVASTPDFGDQMQVPRSSSTAQAPGGWYNIDPTVSVNVYFKIDTTGTAANGTSTLQIT